MSQSRVQSPAVSTYSLLTAVENIPPPPPPTPAQLSTASAPTKPKKKGFRASLKRLVAKLRRSKDKENGGYVKAD